MGGERIRVLYKPHLLLPAGGTMILSLCCYVHAISPKNKYVSITSDDMELNLDHFLFVWCDM